MFIAIKNKDLETAQKINNQIFPLAQAFYSPPFLDMHNRMKEVLVLTGKMDEAIVRPPLMKLSPLEIGKLKKAITLSKI
jgi:4-hydroxy-tetrahydrodipicolinate synthase